MLRSIRWTLQLWHAGILALALVVLGGAFDVGLKRAQMGRLEAELESAARVLVTAPLGSPSREDLRSLNLPPPPFPSNFGPEFPPTPPPDESATTTPSAGSFSGDNLRRSPPTDLWDEIPRNALRRLGESEQDQPYFILWVPDGRVLRASSPELKAPASGERTLPPPAFGTIGPAEFRQRGEFHEVILTGPFGVSVLVGKSMRTEMAALNALRRQLFGAGLAVLAVGLCGGWLLSKRIVRPIEDISNTARSISGSNLARRIAVTDTTSELGSLAHTLNETFARLETAFDRQVRFTADASHELRTPLSVIHSHAELALAKPRTPPEYRQTIETTLKAARRMRLLVESLLTLARSDARQLHLKFERFNLQQVAEECVAQLAPRAQEKKVVIETQLRPLVIESDRLHVSQLLTNLLGNAIQYNRPDGRITLIIAQEGTEAVVQIADTGVGIAAEDQPRIFERFFRADKARSQEAGGIGLGLAICQGLATALHGSISFTSAQGEGSTFSIRLPLLRKSDLP